MTPAELLKRCRSFGIDLSAGSNGTLTWEADTELSADFLQALAANRAEVLAMLTAG